MSSQQPATGIFKWVDEVRRMTPFLHSLTDKTQNIEGVTPFVIHQYSIPLCGKTLCDRFVCNFICARVEIAPLRLSLVALGSIGCPGLPVLFNLITFNWHEGARMHNGLLIHARCPLLFQVANFVIIFILQVKVLDARQLPCLLRHAHSSLRELTYRAC